jgi:hypothetical protein
VTDKRQRKRMPFPPVLKLLVRGYLIIGFILALESFGIVDNVSLIIFTVTIVSISMVFGVGYLLLIHSRPVRQGNIDIPNTVLLFVKGGLVMYFVSLLGHFSILPLPITSLIITGTSLVLVLICVVSYLYEVVERSRPLPKREVVPNPTRQISHGSRS